MEKSENKQLKITAVIFAIVSVIFVIYASITMRGLYMDGSYFLLCQLNKYSNNDFSGITDWTRVRSFILLLQQLPVMFSVSILKIENKTALAMIYSMSQFLLPLLALVWNFQLSKRTKRIDLVFWSLFNWCAVMIMYSIFSVSEALIGASLHFILWNYMAAKIDYTKKDICLIILLSIIMFCTWEYVIFLGPVFFIASRMYAAREENQKNSLVKNLIGISALAAGIFDAVYMFRIMIKMPGEGAYFINEFYDFIPILGEMCSLFSIAAVILLIIAFFKKDKLSNAFVLTSAAVSACILIRLLNTLDISLNPVMEGHMRSITFWMMPVLFFGIYIFDLLKKEVNAVKFQNYITIILLCGIFQTLWQCVHTYFWDVNVKYMKNELKNMDAPLYVPIEHEPVSAFFHPQLRRYIWHGNYAAMSILLADDYEVKTLALSYDEEFDKNNQPFRDRLYAVPNKNLIAVPYGAVFPYKNKYWDLTKCAEALDRYNKEHNIKTAE